MYENRPRRADFDGLMDLFYILNARHDLPGVEDAYAKANFITELAKAKNASTTSPGLVTRHSLFASRTLSFFDNQIRLLSKIKRHFYVKYFSRFYPNHYPGIIGRTDVKPVDIQNAAFFEHFL